MEKKKNATDNLTKKDLTKAILETLGIEAKPEVQFHPVRKWRFDVAIPEHMIAIEIEGGTFSNGRHTRGKGYQSDMEKYNEAVRLGWKLIRVTPQQVNSNYVINLISDLIWKDTTTNTLKASATGSGTNKKK